MSLSYKGYYVDTRDNENVKISRGTSHAVLELRLAGLSSQERCFARQRTNFVLRQQKHRLFEIDRALSKFAGTVEKNVG